MKKPINEFARMQELAGINEIKVRTPRSRSSIDLIDYEYKEYTPEDVRNAIRNNDNSILDDVRVEDYKFMQAMKEYIKEAGYEFSDEFWDSLEGGVTDADYTDIETIDDLRTYSNFTMNDAINRIKIDIDVAIEDGWLEDMGLPEDTTSIEDFKIR